MVGINVGSYAGVGMGATRSLAQTDQAGRGRAASGQRPPAKTPTEPVVEIPLGFIRDNKSLSKRLTDKLSGIFGVFHKGEKGEEITQRAVEGLKPLLDEAKDFKVATIQIRLGSLTTRFDESSPMGGNGKFGEFAVEVSLERDGRVEAADTRVLDIHGTDQKLSQNEIKSGLVDANFTRFKNVGPQAGAALPEDVQSALDALRETQDVLAAFRDGDMAPLKGLIQRMQTGATFSMTA